MPWRSHAGIAIIRITVEDDLQYLMDVQIPRPSVAAAQEM
jgi:hypothetical protein